MIDKGNLYAGIGQPEVDLSNEVVLASVNCNLIKHMQILGPEIPTPWHQNFRKSLGQGVRQCLTAWGCWKKRLQDLKNVCRMSVCLSVSVSVSVSVCLSVSVRVCVCVSVCMYVLM